MGTDGWLAERSACRATAFSKTGDRCAEAGGLPGRKTGRKREDTEESQGAMRGGWEAFGDPPILALPAPAPFPVLPLDVGVSPPETSPVPRSPSSLRSIV